MKKYKFRGYYEGDPYRLHGWVYGSLIHRIHSTLKTHCYLIQQTDGETFNVVNESVGFSMNGEPINFKVRCIKEHPTLNNVKYGDICDSNMLAYNTYRVYGSDSAFNYVELTEREMEEYFKFV